MPVRSALPVPAQFVDSARLRCYTLGAMNRIVSIISVLLLLSHTPLPLCAASMAMVDASVVTTPDRAPGSSTANSNTEQHLAALECGCQVLPAGVSLSLANALEPSGQQPLIATPTRYFSPARPSDPPPRTLSL